MCKARFGSQEFFEMVFKQKKLKKSLWEIPLKISILFFGLPPLTRRFGMEAEVRELHNNFHALVNVWVKFQHNLH